MIATPISIQGRNFITKMDVINLASRDIVLGISWLQTLGNIHRNF